MSAPIRIVTALVINPALPVAAIAGASSPDLFATVAADVVKVGRQGAPEGFIIVTGAFDLSQSPSGVWTLVQAAETPTIEGTAEPVAQENQP